jgi:hypothetical protein
MRPPEHDQRTGLIGRPGTEQVLGRAGSRGTTDRAFAAALTILAGLGAVAVAHRLSGGSVLPSRGLTSALLLAGAGAFAWSWRGRWPRGAVEPGSARYWGPVAGGGVLLVLATWWGDPGGLPGDYTQHRMYTYQLLNGFAAPHVPYAGVPGHYTFLPSSAIAAWMQLSGLSFHFAAMGLACVVSATVARFAFTVASRAGLKTVAAAFFAGLVVLYGGFWHVGQDDFFLYLPAVQLAMPFVARNLALLLVLLGLWLAQAIERGDVGERDGALAAGWIVGWLGLTRPWEFAAAAALLTVWVARTGRRSRAPARGLALAAAIASCYFAPLLVAWWELGVHAAREVARPVELPTSPFLYGPVVLLAIASAAAWRDAPRAVRICWLALAGILVGAGLGALVEAFGASGALALEGGLLKLDRIGQLLALVLFGVAAHGLERLRPRVAAAVAAIVLVVGVASHVRVTTTWLDGEPTWRSARWRQPPSWVFGMEGSRLHLRHLLDDPRSVVMAPPMLGDLIARANGVDVVYSRTAVPIWRDRTWGGLPQEHRLALAERFYADLARGHIDGALLRNVGARWFVAPMPIRSDRVEEVGGLGRLGSAQWRLYRVVDALPPSRGAHDARDRGQPARGPTSPLAH